jgi:hypothetical protein
MDVGHVGQRFLPIDSIREMPWNALGNYGFSGITEGY